MLAQRGGTVALGAMIGALCGLIWQPCAGRTLAKILNRLFIDHAVIPGLVELTVYAVRYRRFTAASAVLRPLRVL